MDTACMTARPFAHRGLHDMALGRAARAPENSLAAFEAAVRAGYGIECDVCLLADGETAVFHDLTLDRLAGRPEPLFTHTASSVRAVRLLDSDQRIPLLADLLDLVAGRVPLYIELKPLRFIGPLERRVAELLHAYSGPCFAASFSPASLGWFNHNAPAIARCLIASNHWQGGVIPPTPRHRLLANLRMRAVAAPHAIAYDLRGLPNPAALHARRDGLPVLTWTARSETDLDKARRVADNVVFENVTP